MSDGNQILIVEDERADYEVIYRSLTNYECYPSSEEFDVFLMHLRGLLERRKLRYVEEAEAFFKGYFNDKRFVSIILDIRLGRNNADRSGLEFLNFLRGRYFSLTPIIMLSSLPITSVKSGLTDAGGLANYYLHKGGREGRLSAEFFRNELRPVLTMLTTWFKMTTPERIIKDLLQSNTEQVIRCLDEKFGVLQSQVDLLRVSIADLHEFARANLSILRFVAKINSKNAGRLADRLIDEFRLAQMVPRLEKFRKPIVDDLRKKYDDIVKILKGEVKGELVDCIKAVVRECLGLDEDDPIFREVLVVLCRFGMRCVKTVVLP